MNLSATDKKWEEYRPGFYLFGPVEHERTCIRCTTKFQTRLRFLQVCTPTCLHVLTSPGRVPVPPAAAAQGKKKR